MRRKLVAVALAALAPVVAMLGYNEYALRQERSEEIRTSAERAARQASSEVERTIEGLHSLLIAVAAMPSVRDLDRQTCTQAIVAVAEKVASIRMIFVLDAQGRAVCGTPGVGEGAGFSDRAYFREALSTKDFVVGTYTQSRMSSSAVLPLAMPVVEKGKVVAVVVTGIRLDWLQNRIAERGIARGNAVTLADTNGTILARVPLPERFVGTVIPDPFKSLTHSASPGVIEVTSQDGTERILGYRPIALPSNPLYVSAGFSKAEAFGPINRATLMNLLGITLGALCALCAAIVVGNRFVLKPVHTISGVLEKRRSGDVSARTAMKGRDELSEVGRTLDRLLDELDCRTRRVEQAEEERTLLVRELTHRVKNGFALVQAMARQTFSRTDREQYQSFTDRLSSLAGTYDLILSKEAKSATLHTVVGAALKAHLAPADQRILITGPEITVGADDALSLSLIIHELATNATKYGSLRDDNGRVELTWRIKDDRIEVSWIETGGPSVVEPSRKGFGSVLISRAFPARAESEHQMTFRPTGLVFEIAFIPELKVLEKVVAGTGWRGNVAL